MYYVRPFFFKKKHYYEKEANISKNDLDDLGQLLGDNATPDDIKNALDKLKKKSDVFINQIDYCDCSIYIDYMNILLDKITDLENKIPRNNFSLVEAFNTSITSVLSWRHVKYIQKYGVPDDGIFLEELLNEFAE